MFANNHLHPSFSQILNKFAPGVDHVSKKSPAYQGNFAPCFVRSEIFFIDEREQGRREYSNSSGELQAAIVD